MATPHEIISEFYAAEDAYRKAFALAISGDEMVALPKDVREARAALVIEAEAERLRRARIAIETMKAEREERWIAAHEDLAILRNPGRVPFS